MAVSRIFGKLLQAQSAGPMCLTVCSRQYSGDTTLSFDVPAFKLHRLTEGPSTKATITVEDALRLYTQMQTIRRMETVAANMYKEKKIRGFCHLYSGQEAIAVGMKSALIENDAIITAYRCHGWTYLMGVPPQDILSELAGKVCGNVYGKGGSMHMYAKHFYGGNGIVGAQVPLGTGVAFAYKYRKEPNLCVSLYGDGAANQGQLYEAINMASLWNLPCIFVCENNGYGMGTSVDRSSASTEYYTRGDYVPGIWVDAMDIMAVRQATLHAAEICRAGKGPIVLEMTTYRYHGHSMSDPGTSYRTREEIQEVRKTRDPIVGFKDELIATGAVPEADLKKIDKEVRQSIEAALSIADTAPEPPTEVAFTDVYKDEPNLLIRGQTVEDQIVPPALTTEEFLKQAGIKSTRSQAYN